MAWSNERWQRAAHAARLIENPFLSVVMLKEMHRAADSSGRPRFFIGPSVVRESDPFPDVGATA